MATLPWLGLASSHSVPVSSHVQTYGGEVQEDHKANASRTFPVSLDRNDTEPVVKLVMAGLDVALDGAFL